MLVMIGMTSGRGEVSSTYTACMFNLLLWSRGHIRDIRFAIVDAQSSIVANARNQCVEAALSVGADKLLMIDSDMRFDHDTLARLLAHDKPVVGGLYRRRSPPHEILGVPLGGGSGDFSGLVEMETLPTGCILIDHRVFNALPAPWFRFGVEQGKIIGEDVQFSRDCRKAGIPLWADCDISLGHITSTVLENV
jgi:hypothetical protein